jgi:hypothetical protein
MPRQDKAMIFTILVTIAIVAASVLAAARLLRKMTTENPYHWLAALLTSVAFGVGALYVTFFVIHAISGIGPNITSGEVPARIAVQIASLNFALGAFISWSTVRSGIKAGAKISKSAPYSERIEPKVDASTTTEESAARSVGQASSDKYDMLVKLKNLHDAGILDDEEYKKEKQVILEMR